MISMDLSCAKPLGTPNAILKPGIWMTSNGKQKIRKETKFGKQGIGTRAALIRRNAGKAKEIAIPIQSAMVL